MNDKKTAEKYWPFRQIFIPLDFLLQDLIFIAKTDLAPKG